MYRVSLANVTAHRTCSPLHEKHQATPYATFLDPAEVRNIYSGQVLARTGPDTVGVYDSAVAGAVPFGLSALDRNTIINDLDGLSDIGIFAVWIGAADAFFRLDAPAFDTGVAYTVPTTGARALLYGGTGGAVGKITSAVAGPPVAELIQVVSATRIIVRLLPPGVAV